MKMEKMYNELAPSIALEKQRYALMSILYTTEMAEICHQEKVVGWYFFSAMCPELIGLSLSGELVLGGC